MDAQPIPHREYLELELLNQQLKGLEDSLTLAQQHIEQATLALTMLESFKNATVGQEILVPIGGGAFITVQAKDVNAIKLSVGAGVVVEKPIPDVIVIVQQQLEEAKRLHEQTAQSYNQTVEKSMLMQQNIEAKLRGQQNK